MEVILGYLISNAPELGSLTAFHSLLLKIAEQPITLLLGDDNVVLLLTQIRHCLCLLFSLYLFAGFETVISLASSICLHPIKYHQGQRCL